MFRFAWRQLLLDPFRTLLTAFALGAVIAVIMILEGFEQGQYHQLARSVHNRQADLIVTQAGVFNLLGARSSLPQLSRGQVESVPGVANAHPLTAIVLIYEKQGRKTPMYIFVYDTIGGPVSIAQGHAIRESRDIIVDASLAKRHDIHPGDSLAIFEFEFRVVGITTDNAALFTPFAFINYDGMIDLFIESDIAPDLTTFPLLSYLLVELDPTARREVVADEIERLAPEVDVFTPEELAENDVSMGRALLGPVMRLLVFVSYIIGLLVVGLIMYAEVRSRLRSFGVLKALGFRHASLAYAIVLQALLLLILSMPLGVIVAQGAALFIHEVAPLYVVRIFEPVPLVQTVVASVAFAVIGALIPLRSIRRADPMMTFQGG